jgi:hypothetical protein
MAFFSTLHEIANWLLYDFDTQVLRFLVPLNFGQQSYEVRTIPITGDQNKPPEPPPIPGQEPIPGEEGDEEIPGEESGSVKNPFAKSAT